MEDIRYARRWDRHARKPKCPARCGPTHRGKLAKRAGAPLLSKSLSGQSASSENESERFQCLTSMA